MPIAKIKVGLWYRTTLGDGKCVRSGGTHPPSCQIQIVGPIPRGICNFRPRDVLEQIAESEAQVIR